MVLFKKLKTRLRNFLEKHESNPFILIPIYLVVGLVNTLLVMLGTSIVSIPLALIATEIGMGWTICIVIAIMVLLLVGFMVCVSIQTNSNYKENKPIFD